MKQQRLAGLAALTVIVVAMPLVGVTRAHSSRPGARGVFISGTNTGIYRSSDGGATWQKANDGLPANVYVSALAVAPTNTSIVYAGTWNHGLYVSRDGGSSWQARNGGDLSLANSAVTGLAIDPFHMQTVYATNDEPGVYRSGDGGSTWSFMRVQAGSISKVAVNPLHPSILLAGANAYGLFKSSDRGHTWSKTSGSSMGVAYGLAFNPTNPDVAFVATGNGLYETIDGAHTWQLEKRGIHGVVDFRSVAVDPRDGTNIIAASHGGDIYRSADGGTSWTLSGSASGFPAYAIAFDPAREGHVIIGDNHGIVLSDDHGAKWKAASALQGQEVDVLAATTRRM